MRILVLFTGTIEPNVSRQVVLTNPALREAEYTRAITANVGQLKETLREVDFVFAENSSWKMTDSLDLLSGLGVWVCRLATPRDVSIRGKGACELDMLAQLMPFIAGYDYCIKITGRLTIANANELFVPRILRRRPSAIVDIHPLLTYIDTRVIVLRTDVLETILARRELVDDNNGHWVEHFVLSSIMEHRSSRETLELFSVLPSICGVSGSIGRDYGPRGLGKKIAHEILRVTKPWRRIPVADIGSSPAII